MLSATRHIALVVALSLGVLVSVAAGSASAGEYSVNVCRNADGSVAPTDGWQFAIADDFSANDIADDRCAIGGLIELQLRDGTSHGRLSGATYAGAQISFFAAPPGGTAWRGAEVWWAYASNPAGPGGGSEQITGSIAGAPQTTCAWAAAPPCSARNLLAGPPLNPVNRSSVSIPADQSTAPLAVTVTCSSAPLACPSVVGGNPYAQLRAWRLLVTLADDSAPAFSAQPALPSQASGQLSTTISATDGGSGVRSAQLVVDGAPVGTPQVVDAANGRCAARPDGSFSYLVPCRLSVSSVPVALDIGGVANGVHSVSVRLADASGNVVDSAPQSVTLRQSVALTAIPTDNPLRGKGHVHNGSGSAEKGTVTAGLRRGTKGRLHTRMSVRRGGRVRLAGRLLGSDGKPIAGAILSVTSTRPKVAPHHFTVRTRSDGTYSRTMRWGPSRRLVVRWYPFGDSTQASPSRSVRLLGVARVTLGVTPLRPLNGHPLRFSGHVTGARSGTRVVIQVRDRGLWRTFLVPAVHRRGRFRASRTLSRSAGLSYCLRARVLSQPNFAYAPGSSRRVCRRVR